jgi:hypothetical protein
MYGHHKQSDALRIRLYANLPILKAIHTLDVEYLTYEIQLGPLQQLVNGRESMCMRNSTDSILLRNQGRVQKMKVAWRPR